MHWRLLLSPAGSAAHNMALDEALMERAAATGEAVLRVYSWQGPTLSLGRNQPALGKYDLDAMADARISLVRRPTGGRAILHYQEVTYSLTAPAGPLGELRESYARVNRLLIEGLRALGVEVDVAPRTGPAPAPDNSPCFVTPVAGELTVGGRKLVGSAQWRDRGALLQHGSILIRDDQALLTRLLLSPTPPAPPPATLHDALGRSPSVADVARRIFAAVQVLEDPRARELDVEPAVQRESELLEARYSDERWTWRR